MEVILIQEKPLSPLKLNHEWLKRKYFLNKLKFEWKPFDTSLDELTPIQFHPNLKRLNKVPINWSLETKKKDDRILMEVEEFLDSCCNKECFGFLTKNQKDEIKLLEDTNRQILLGRVKEWRIKSKDIWLQVEDEHRKIFHKYANNIKNVNLVWKIEREDGSMDPSVLDMASEGVN